MRTAPLQLDAYVFTKILVEANTDYLPEKQEEIEDSEINFSLQITVGKDNDNPLRYQIEIHISDFKPKKSGFLPYKIDAKVVGIFSVDPDFKHDDLEHLIHINGASMLFGAAREYILMVSGRGPYGPFKLPTINLIPTVKSGEEKQIEESPTDAEKVNTSVKDI
ncbi:MAG: protein-export chaperone SecB [Gammaproteobacteria bacterium]